MDTYSGIIQEMSNTGAQLIAANHPDSKLIRQRDELLNREFKVSSHTDASSPDAGMSFSTESSK